MEGPRAERREFEVDTCRFMQKALVAVNGICAPELNGSWNPAVNRAGACLPVHAPGRQHGIGRRRQE